MVVRLNSEQETRELGKKLASTLSGGEIILLYGDMGAGKTALTKGIATGLSIKEEISSPTFTLLNIYHAKLCLYHYDLFRLNCLEEAEEAGLTEYFGNLNGVSVIEWPDKVDLEYYGKRIIKVKMMYIDENTRQAEIEGLD